MMSTYMHVYAYFYIYIYMIFFSGSQGCQALLFASIFLVPFAFPS